MKGTIVRSYVKRDTGNRVFVYAVDGSKANLEEFKKAQGDNYLEDKKSGKPLFFTTRNCGVECPMEVIENGEGKLSVVMNDVMKVMAQEDAYQIALQQERAKIAAKELFFGKTPGLPSLSTPAETQTEEVVEEGDLVP